MLHPGYLYLCVPLKPAKYRLCLKLGQTGNIEKRLSNHGVYQYPSRILFIGYTFGDRTQVEKSIKDYISRRVSCVDMTTEYFDYHPQLVNKFIEALRKFVIEEGIVLYDSSEKTEHPTVEIIKNYKAKIETYKRKSRELESMSWESTK